MRKLEETALHQYLQIGPRIRKIREQRRLTLEEFSSMIELSKASVSKMETGKQTFSIKQLIRVAYALDVSLDELLGRRPHIETRVREQKDTTNVIVYSDMYVNEENELIKTFHSDNLVVTSIMSGEPHFCYLQPHDNLQLGLIKGDVLLIEKSKKYKTEDVLVIATQEHGVEVRKVVVQKDTLIFISLELNKKDYKIPKNERSQIKILGKLKRIERNL